MSHSNQALASASQGQSGRTAGAARPFRQALTQRGTLTRSVELMNLLVEGKLYSLFSLRRMGALLGIGLFHILVL